MLCFRFASRLPEGPPSYNLSVTCGDTSPGRRGLGIAQTSPPRQGSSSLCRYSRHLPPAGGSLSYQGSWREAPERLYPKTPFRRFALPFVHLFSPMDCFFIENSFVRWFECIFRLCRWLHPSFRRSPQRKSRTSGQKIVEKDDFSLDKAHFGSVQL